MKTQEIKQDSFYKKILLLAAPISAQQLITLGVNLMDSIMLGQLNEVDLAASSMAGQVHILFGFMCMGLGMGAAVLISRFWGANDRMNLKRAVALMYRFTILVAVLFTMMSIFFGEQIMLLLTPEKEVVKQGIVYLNWSFPCFILFGFSQTTTIVLRNSKKMHIPLYTSIGAFFVNVFFNWVFIFGKLGAPAMGIAGAALGTLISRVFEFTVICGYFFIKDTSIHFRIPDIGMKCKDLVHEYVRISLPVLISDTLLGLGNSAVLAVAGHIGTAFMSANTITNVVQQISSVFSSGIGQAALIVTGNSLGEGDVQKTKEYGRAFLKVGVLIGLFVAFLITVISPRIISFYKISAETAYIASELMKAMSFIVTFMMLQAILTKGILRGGGDTRFLMIADVLFLWLVSVPLGALAGIVWNLPPFIVLLCLRIDNVLKVILCLFRMRDDRWIKKIKLKQ